jgi:ArsR family transcriptional regulator
MRRTDSIRTATLCFALGHERRLRILQTLSSDPSSGRTLGRLEVSTRLARASLLHHLRQLERAGLVRRRKRGAETEYSSDLSPVRWLNGQLAGVPAALS